MFGSEESLQFHKGGYMIPRVEYVDLIGKPFCEIKCWELVEELYNRSGVVLPSYTNMQVWEEVAEPIELDVLAFALIGKELDHVGVFVGDGKFVHATEANGVCVERMSRYLSKLKGIYRYKEV